MREVARRRQESDRLETGVISVIRRHARRVEPKNRVPTILTLGSFSSAITVSASRSLLIGIESQLLEITRLFSPATGGERANPQLDDKVLMTVGVGEYHLLSSSLSPDRRLSLYPPRVPLARFQFIGS